MARRNMELKVVSLNRVYRPVPFDKLVQLATQGRLSPQDLVRPVGTETWYPVSEVPALAASLPQPVFARTAAEGGPVVDLEGAARDRWIPRPSALRAEEPAMDMAPMIDVTFLLLIFFMLSNSMANPTPMDVPAAVHGRGVTLEGQQQILLDQEGSYYLGNVASEENRAESLEALIEEVQGNADASSATLDVIINAHKKLSYVRIRELVEQLGNVQGLGDVMLGVEEELE
jgi:biopolymer transport protein ExbD